MKIELRSLNYIYGANTPFEHAAVRDIDLTIGAGERIALIGHTGSGKSTLIRHLNGLLRPVSGAVLHDGKDIFADKQALKEARFKVGVVFQYPEYQLFEETVYKDIAFGPRNMGLPEETIGERVRESMERVGLSEALCEVSPFELSGGQKRRVAIAGVLAMRPELLVLDEPTAGLDPGGCREIMRAVCDYAAEGRSVLFVSHSMADAADYAERILVMNDSRLIMDGSVSEVFSRAEELKKTGLSVPQITEVFLRLKEMGYDVPTDVYTVKHAASEILRIKGGAR